MSEPRTRRLGAYYYSFGATGVGVIDKVLGAVACAGKAYHHTEYWHDSCSTYDDHTGETPVEWIQNAAQEAASRITALEAENKALREGLVKAGRTVGVLLQAVEGCAMNHYGEDFYLHGLPQYLVECRSEIEAARALLAKGGE